MKRLNGVILIVDDNHAEQILLRRAFQKFGTGWAVECVSSGKEAVAYLSGSGDYADRQRYPYPSMLITDLHMESGDGFMVLGYLHTHPERRIIPTLVLSSSDDPEDMKRCYQIGASAYLVKPMMPDQSRELVRHIYDFWMDVDVPPSDRQGNWT